MSGAKGVVAVWVGGRLLQWVCGWREWRDGGMMVGGKRYRLKEERETEGRRERREWSKSLKRRKNALVGGCAEEVLAVGVQKGWE